MSAPSRLMLAVALAAASAILAPAPASGGTYDVHQCDWAASIPDHDFVWQAWGAPPLIPHTGRDCGEHGLSAHSSAPGAEQTYPSGGYGGWFAYAPPGTLITHFSGAFGTLANCCINGLAAYAEAMGRDEGSGALAYLFQGNLGNHTWYGPSGLGGPVGRGWDASTSGFEAERVGFQVRCGSGFPCSQRTSGDLRVRGRSFRFTLRDAAPPTVGVADGTLLADGWLRGAHTLSFGGFDIGGGVAAVEAEFDNGTVVRSPAPCTIVRGEYVRLRPCPAAHAGAWTVDTATLPDGWRTVALRVRDASGATATDVRSLRVDNTPPVVRSGPGPDGTGRTSLVPVPTRRKATVTIAATRKLLRGGGRTLFHGRVRGGSIPDGGKLVEVQAHFRGRWRTISVVRSRRDGRWRFPYRFRPAATTARYRMRARVPAEAGYPFAAGTSRPVRVTVHPR